MTPQEFLKRWPEEPPEIRTHGPSMEKYRRERLEALTDFLLQGLTDLQTRVLTLEDLNRQLKRELEWLLNCRPEFRQQISLGMIKMNP